MQIYKTFLKMLIRNLPSGLLYLGIFVGIAIVVTNNGQNKDIASFTSSKLNVAIIDDDNSELSKSLVDYISSCHNIVSINDNKEKWADDLFYRTVDYILVINKGFEDAWPATPTPICLSHTVLPIQILRISCSPRPNLIYRTSVRA